MVAKESQVMVLYLGQSKYKSDERLYCIRKMGYYTLLLCTFCSHIFKDTILDISLGNIQLIWHCQKGCHNVVTTLLQGGYNIVVGLTCARLSAKTWLLKNLGYKQFHALVPRPPRPMTTRWSGIMLRPKCYGIVT